MSRRLLTVTLIGGKNLVSAEKKGTSSPYAVVTLTDLAGRAIKNENATSSHKSKTLQPKWNERMNFGQHYDLNNVDALPTVKVELFHKSGSLIGSDVPLGQLEIPLSSIPADGTPFTQWYQLSRMAKNEGYFWRA